MTDNDDAVLSPQKIAEREYGLTWPMHNNANTLAVPRDGALQARSARCAAVLVELRASLPTEEVAKCQCNMCSWLRENRGAQ